VSNVPREANLEFYLGGWVTIDARQNRPITMTRGRLDWARDVSPGAFTAELSDDSGNLNPDNPIGTYYGLLGVNTPMRFSYTLLRDTFGRTSVDTWGTTTPDSTTTHTTATLPWSLSGTAANFDVGSGVGTMVVATTFTKRLAYLPDITHRNITVTVDLPSFTLPGADANRQAIALRGTSTSSYVAVEVDVNSAGTVRLAIRDTNDNTYLVNPTTVAGVVRTSTMRLMAQVEGQTISGKVWNPSGNNEPYDVQVSAVSTLMASTGWVGLRAESGANINTTYTWDNLVVISRRFFGVTGRITPKRDTTGLNKYAVLKGSDTLGRLERNTAAARSAPRVYIPTTAAVAYWPLEGGTLSIAGEPVIGDQPIQLGNNLIALQAASQYFGQGDLGPFLNPGMTLHGGGDFAGGLVSMPGFIHQFAVDVVRAGGQGITTKLLVYTISSAAVVTVSFTLTFYGAAQEIAITPPDGIEEVHLSVPQLYDGAAHHVRLYLSQNGANVAFIVDIDGTNTYSGSNLWTGTLDPVWAVFVTDEGTANHTEKFAFAHLTVYAEGRPTSEFATPVLGWPGETAGIRIQRLCDENDIPFSYVGDLDATMPMGPQRVAPLLTLLQECARTDAGSLLGSRMGPGLVYRTGASLYSQAAGLSLSLASHQLNDEFDPVHDDRDTQNRVTARRFQGGEYVATQTVGPRNINDPGTDPDGVGIYDASFEVNPDSDIQLASIANWALHLGTSTAARVPALTVVTGNQHITAADDAALLSVDVDDRVMVSSVTSRDIYEPVTQLARGYTETLDTIYNHKITFNGVPENPYHVGVYDATTSRYDSAGTTLNEDLDTTETGVDVAVTDTLWGHSNGNYDVMVGGERMTVTAVSGSSSPQTLTVTRSVNGVVKTHTTGDSLSLADPVFYGVR
jgi:hypothetical protein